MSASFTGIETTPHIIPQFDNSSGCISLGAPVTALSSLSVVVSVPVVWNCVGQPGEGVVLQPSPALTTADIIGIAVACGVFALAVVAVVVGLLISRWRDQRRNSTLAHLSEVAKQERVANLDSHVVEM